MRRLLLVFVLLDLTAAVVKAADSAGTTPMYVTLEREPVNFIEPRYRAYVSAESNRFAFRVPAGYRISGDPASGTLTLASRLGNGSITFAIYGPAPADGAKLMPETFRESLTNDYSNAVIAEEFWRDNAGGGGPGFELQWKAVGSLVECKRIIFVSSPAGVLRFTVTGGRADFPKLRGDLDSIILSLQTTVNGTKPKMVPLNDKS